MSNGTPEPIGRITIFYSPTGDHRVEPEPGILDRDHQEMTWNLVAPEGVEFLPAGGIDFLEQEGFSRWPGDQPSGDALTYRANVRLQVPHGDPSQLYKYIIVLDTPNGHEHIQFRRMGKTGGIEIIDPDIENQPKP